MGGDPSIVVPFAHRERTLPNRRSRIRARDAPVTNKVLATDEVPIEEDIPKMGATLLHITHRKNWG